jgi:hypothetical protein
MASSDLGTIFGSGGFIISILGAIYAWVNHKRIRGKCCGREIDVEINIDSTTNPDGTPSVHSTTASSSAASTTAPKIHSAKSKLSTILPFREKRNIRPDSRNAGNDPVPIAVRPQPRRWMDDDADKELEEAEDYEDEESGRRRL